MFDSTGFGLEIGPSYNPLLPKSKEWSVETIDYADQATLVHKYADNPSVDVSRIEAVDYVSDGRSMVEVIGARERYDFILASHVIEHTPDLIGFLKDCEALLKPDGVLVLAVPDKRCCFDVFQRLTSTGEVLEAHFAARKRPSFGCIFDEMAYGVTQDGASGWGLGEKGNRQFVQSVTQARASAAFASRHGKYVDVHVWRFVPSSFELILNDLFEIGEIALCIVEMKCAGEFLVTLKRGRPRVSRTRLELLAASLVEQSYEETATARRDVDREHEAVVRRLEEKSDEVIATRDEIDALQRKYDALQSDLADAQRLRLTLENQFAALCASKSWRVTAPFRSVIQWFRKPASTIVRS